MAQVWSSCTQLIVNKVVKHWHVDLPKSFWPLSFPSTYESPVFSTLPALPGSAGQDGVTQVREAHLCRWLGRRIGKILVNLVILLSLWEVGAYMSEGIPLHKRCAKKYKCDDEHKGDDVSMQLHRSMQIYVLSANLLLPSLLVPLVEAFWPSCSLAPLPHIPHSGRRNGWTCILCGNSLGKPHDESHRCCRVAVSANIWLKSESKTPILGRIHAHWQQILTKLTISLKWLHRTSKYLFRILNHLGISLEHRSFPSLPGAVLIECEAIIRAKRIEMCNECSSGRLKQLLQSMATRGCHDNVEQSVISKKVHHQLPNKRQTKKKKTHVANK